MSTKTTFPWFNQPCPSTLLGPHLFEVEQRELELLALELVVGGTQELPTPYLQNSTVLQISTLFDLFHKLTMSKMVPYIQELLTIFGISKLSPYYNLHIEFHVNIRKIIHVTC